MYDHEIWLLISQLSERIRRLRRRCRNLERELTPWLQFFELKRQLALLKTELDKVRAQPTQLVIQKLENRIDRMEIATLEGILNIGVALNQSGALEAENVKLGGQSVGDLLKRAMPPRKQESLTEGNTGREAQPGQGTSDNLTEAAREQLRDRRQLPQPLFPPYGTFAAPAPSPTKGED